MNLPLFKLIAIALGLGLLTTLLLSFRPSFNVQSKYSFLPSPASFPQPEPPKHTLPEALTPPLSFSVWVYPVAGGQNTQAPFTTNPGTTGEVRFGTWDNWQTAEANVPSCGESKTQPLPANFLSRWHLLVRVYDHTVVKTYIDGYLNDTTPYSGCTPTARSVNIGVPLFTGIDPFYGQIKQLKFYDQLLTPTQIQTLHTIGH